FRRSRDWSMVPRCSMLDYGLNILMRCSRRLEGRFKLNQKRFISWLNPHRPDISHGDVSFLVRLRADTSAFGAMPKVSDCAPHFRLLDYSRPTRLVPGTSKMTSRPKDFHLRALPDPCMNLSIHTAPDVRPLP